MAYNSSSLLPRLPQELQNSVLRQIEDNPFLWAVCRQVSRGLRKEVEYIFLEGLLKETVVQWTIERGSHWKGLLYLCPFARTSDDGATAFFTLSATFRSMIYSPELQLPVDLDELQGMMDRYADPGSWRPYPYEPPIITQIGTQINNTMMTDITLPNLQLHRSTAELSFDWKAFFSASYHEQYTIDRLKHQNGKKSTAIVPFPTSHPLVLLTSLIGSASICCLDDLEEECQGYRARMIAYHGASDMPSRGVDKLSQCVYTDVKIHAAWKRAGDLVRKHDMQLGECRGQMCYVEDPGSWGWKKWNWRYVRNMAPKWYNHAWEDETDGEKTTVSEDEVVVEVERMARAWEKGLA